MEDDQQFCLRWNNHQTTLIQNFDTLLESGTLVDCTLAAEGKYLKAHKVVLSACSPYFEGLLSEHYDKHPVFILKDVKFKELKAMMDYMYRGEVNISQDQLAALLKAAESLQIKGLSESRTGGNACPKPDTRQNKLSSQPTAPSLDIPHASSGLTIEKNNKVPRQSLAQSSVGDLPEDSASPSIPKGLSSREGSQSPVSRKRKRLRRRSVGEDNSVENHESNSSDMTQANVPAMGIAPVADEKSHADPADSLGRSALMQQLTKPADEMLQLPVEKPEPTEDMIQPKSEYLDDPEESVEDLTLDDDMNDLNEMEDSNRAGPSTHDPSQHPGLAAWHVTGDRSNAGGVVGVPGGPGNQDEVFLAAHEAVQAQRDSQDKMKKSTTDVLADFQFVDFSVSELPTILAREFELEDDQPDSQRKRPKMGEDEDSRYSSGFKQFVVRELIKIKAQLDNIQQGQQQLVSKIEVVDMEPKEANAMDKFMEEYSLNLPFKSVTEFEHFDLTLRSNPIARNKFMNSLLDLFDRNHIATKTLVTIMKKYMSRDVALNYTAVKPVKDKLVLKGTTFCKCVINVLLKNHVDKVTGNKATEQTLISALGSVLANAKDWEGYRARRFKSSMQRDENESSN